MTISEKQLGQINNASNTVIITGGASGIGAAVARKVIAGGGHVGIIDINIDRANEFVAELGERAVAAQADATDLASVDSAYAYLVEKLPEPNGLVNCAGKPPVPEPIENQDLDKWQSVVDSHLRATFITCKVIGSDLVKRGGGAIVNIASVLAYRAGPVLDYGPAKSGIKNLTQSLAVHWAAKGVRVNGVAPGWTDTPFLRPAERGNKRDFAPILSATPMGRLMQPEEIANVILFLISDLASAVTGVTVPCDGGVIAGSGWGPYGGFPIHDQ